MLRPVCGNLPTGVSGLMPTAIEKRISHSRRRKGVLVPLIEDFMLHGKPDVESQEDIDHLNFILEREVQREHDRKTKPGTFSPSALASCLRLVYLQRHYRQFGIRRLKEPRLEPMYYWLTGDFIHLKWQFVFWKMDKFYSDDVFKWVDVEVSVESKRGDHRGTIDNIGEIYRIPYIIDWKGVNVRTFGDTVNGNAPLSYRVQLADYIMLYNAERTRKGPRIERGLLLTENKGGPTKRQPIALHETEVMLKDYLPEVRSRLEVLRQHEEEGEIPSPECVSVNTFQFQSCPFRKFCRQEVTQIAREKAGDKENSRFRVATPHRSRKGRRR